jgi:flagellar hook-length control protein FliK
MEKGNSVMMPAPAVLTPVLPLQPLPVLARLPAPAPGFVDLLMAQPMVAAKAGPAAPTTSLSPEEIPLLTPNEEVQAMATDETPQPPKVVIRTSPQALESHDNPTLMAPPQKDEALSDVQSMPVQGPTSDETDQALLRPAEVTNSPLVVPAQSPPIASASLPVEHVARSVAPPTSDGRLRLSKLAAPDLKEPALALQKPALRLLQEPTATMDSKSSVASPIFEPIPAASAPVETPLPTLTPAAVKPLDIIAVMASRPVADQVLQTAERVLDVARGNAWLDQLASDIVAAKDSDRALSFRLLPAQLGQLDVRIETRDDGMQLNFATQNDEAAQVVAAAQPKLVDELRGQGVRIAGSDVSTASGQNSSGGQPQSQAQRQPPQHIVTHSASFRKPTNDTAPRDNGRFA